MSRNVREYCHRLLALNCYGQGQQEEPDKKSQYLLSIMFSLFYRAIGQDFPSGDCSPIRHSLNPPDSLNKNINFIPKGKVFDCLPLT